ncbi:MAG: hypothetical protein KDJ52_00360 [Anaerolineae bacterium]|nr:hypothetical protein [Anaerolineae bacterium]
MLDELIKQFNEKSAEQKIILEKMQAELSKTTGKTVQFTSGPALFSHYNPHSSKAAIKELTPTASIA